MKRTAILFAVLAVFVSAPVAADAKLPLDCCIASK